jgi:tetratricopeptide (TPR) repeat protein
LSRLAVSQDKRHPSRSRRKSILPIGSSRLGKFAEAGELYARIAAQNPKDRSATLQLGRIALLSNRLDDAQKWLEEAIALQPGDDDAKVMLAEAFYRRDDF